MVPTEVTLEKILRREDLKENHQFNEDNIILLDKTYVESNIFVGGESNRHIIFSILIFLLSFLYQTKEEDANI